MSVFWFDGKCSRDFGVEIERIPKPVFGSRRYEYYEIAGRDGAEVREDGTLKNYVQPYSVWLTDNSGLDRDIYDVSRKFANWILGTSGFCKFEDSYEPEYIRMAHFAGPLEFETELRTHGSATLNFTFQPRRYLKAGQKPIKTIKDDDDIVVINPTDRQANPLIHIQGPSGTCTFSVTTADGDNRVYIVDLSLRPGHSITIDAFTYNITYDDGQNAASAVTVMAEYFALPVLKAGKNTVSAAFTNNETETTPAYIFSITPRWWDP